MIVLFVIYDAVNVAESDVGLVSSTDADTDPYNADADTSVDANKAVADNNQDIGGTGVISMLFLMKLTLKFDQLRDIRKEYQNSYQRHWS